MKSVLIVDDASFMRGSLKLMLERNGYKVIGEAENGKVAIQKFRDLKPDIITMDITMPEMDGIEAVKAIRAIDPTSVIVMISAMGQQPNVVEAVQSGAKGFIVKPFKEEHVLKALEKL